MKNEQMIIAEICEILGTEEEIAAVYVFGSFVQGRLTSHGDLDVAILFTEGLVPDALGLLDLSARLTDALGVDVDIACLNTAGPVLAMQVLKKGKKILVRDAYALAEFLIRVVNSYDDLKRVRKPIEQQILRGRVCV